MCFANYLFIYSYYLGISEREERYNFVIPIMKALLERCEDMLNVTALLPSMPRTRNNPSFCEEFREFLHSSEWMSFMTKQVEYHLSIHSQLVGQRDLMVFYEEPNLRGYFLCLYFITGRMVIR